MEKQRKAKRVNINFRQTAREFASARQAQIFQHIKSNIPFNMGKFSRSKFTDRLRKINETIARQKEDIAMRFKRQSKTQK